MHTHDNTCAALAGVGPHNPARPLSWLRWQEFNAWVSSRAAPTHKLAIQYGLGLDAGIDAPGARLVRAHGAAVPADKQPPLVTSCISQHAQASAFLVSSPDMPHRLEFEVYRRDIRVVRRLRVSAPRPVPAGLRSSVSGFSEGSRRRLQRTASNARHALVSQFALTYHESNPDGATVKRHLNSWLTWLRRRVPGIVYLWILEFQSRGVPHFHVYLSIEAKPISDLHFLMAMAWHRITGEASPSHLKFHAHATNWIKWDMGGAGYLCKYLDKEAQKVVPDGFGFVGRFWGCTRGLLEAPYVWSAEEVRAMGGQGKDTHGIHIEDVSRATSEHPIRDVTATIIRTLSEFQKASRRRFGWKGRTLVQKVTSVWVTGGTAVLWRQLEYMLDGEGHLRSG